MSTKTKTSDGLDKYLKSFERFENGAGGPTEIGGVEVPVMPLDTLTAYKSALDRDVDRQDLAELDAGPDDEGEAPS